MLFHIDVMHADRVVKPAVKHSHVNTTCVTCRMWQCDMHMWRSVSSTTVAALTCFHDDWIDGHVHPPAWISCQEHFVQTAIRIKSVHLHLQQEFICLFYICEKGSPSRGFHLFIHFFNRHSTWLELNAAPKMLPQTGLLEEAKVPGENMQTPNRKAWVGIEPRSFLL